MPAVQEEQRSALPPEGHAKGSHPLGCVGAVRFVPKKLKLNASWREAPIALIVIQLVARALSLFTPAIIPKVVLSRNTSRTDRSIPASVETAFNRGTSVNY